MFSDAQEVDLGDAMAETLALHVNVIQNDELTAHLHEIGKRLIQHLPPTQLKFRFYLVDLPEVNAFSIAGGRVYVSRKMVAFVHNDNELAGVLAHELGHLVTHQTAIEMTHAFREVLGVTQVGDHSDIFSKFHHYVENIARQPRSKHRQEEKHQLVADQVAIFTLARAGYPPQAMLDFWDRFGELHGAKGNWFTDLFGVTTTEQHRLRDMAKETAVLPAGCVDHPTTLDEANFKVWQDSVVDYDEQRTESLPGLILRRKFSEPLRPEIRNLRFSQDGKYILAQDDGGINVVSRDPFTFLFYISAPDARDAQFSPDSRSIVFMTSSLRVETWSIARHKRASVYEITLRDPCFQSELSLDGKTLVCLDSKRVLLLVDVASSAVILRKEAFYQPSLLDALELLNGLRLAADPDSNLVSGNSFRFINVGFSPDGRYLLASHGAIGLGTFFPSVLLFDLIERHDVSVPGSIKGLAGLAFTFIGSDKILGINPSEPQKSHLVRFPSGEKISDVPLGLGNSELRGATHGDFLFVGPLKDYPIGILDLATNKIHTAIRKRAADMYDGVFVTEQMNGQLALHSKDSDQPLATLQLPESSLGRLRSAAVSPDLNYLAVSTRSRGAVWDIANDHRILHVRGFNGAAFDGQAMYADFPKFMQTPHAIGELRLDTGAGVPHRELGDEIAVQHGDYLVETKPRNKNNSAWSNVDLQVSNIATGQLLWSRYFHAGPPAISFNTQAQTALFRWRFADPEAKQEIRSIPDFKTHGEKDDYFCEVVDANLGGLIAYFAVKTNNASLRFSGGSATRNWAVMEAVGDQILTYSLPSGDEAGHFFGAEPVLSTSGLLAVQGEAREITVYDLASSEQKQQYRFTQPVAFKEFSPDSRRLLVFTNDQTMYLLDTTLNPPASEPVVTSERK